MPDIVILSLKRPNNCDHIHIVGTVDGVQQSVETSKQEIANMMSTFSTREKILFRCYQKCKQDGATSNAQIKASLEGFEFII